ncbi:MAG: flavodoxin [Oscillospiraceae bacterium]|nr:flavodoxin [Oscillospiraceae bacterium]
MSKTAVIYWSGTGNTEAMAQAVFDGAKEVNPETVLFTVSEISAADAAGYDTLIMGCPAMGAETLEESEFEPFFTEIEGSISGKNIALFGSYGWGDGEWMRSWEERVNAAGAKLVIDSVIANDAPDDDALAQCAELGKTAANA